MNLLMTSRMFHSYLLFIIRVLFFRRRCNFFSMWYGWEALTLFAALFSPHWNHKKMSVMYCSLTNNQGEYFLLCLCISLILCGCVCEGKCFPFKCKKVSIYFLRPHFSLDYFFSASSFTFIWDYYDNGHIIIKWYRTTQPYNGDVLWWYFL